MLKNLLFSCIVLLFASLAHSQVITPVTTYPGAAPTAPADSMRDVEILHSRILTIQKLNDSTTLQILAGAVRLKQGTGYFDCDSCVINNNTHTFEAWGHVHINDSDTANLYASHLRYLIDKRIAYLDGRSLLKSRVIKLCGCHRCPVDAVPTSFGPYI